MSSDELFQLGLDRGLYYKVCRERVFVSASFDVERLESIRACHKIATGWLVYLIEWSRLCGHVSPLGCMMLKCIGTLCVIVAKFPILCNYLASACLLHERASMQAIPNLRLNRTAVTCNPSLEFYFARAIYSACNLIFVINYPFGLRQSQSGLYLLYVLLDRLDSCSYNPKTFNCKLESR